MVGGSVQSGRARANRFCGTNQRAESSFWVSKQRWESSPPHGDAVVAIWGSGREGAARGGALRGDSDEVATLDVVGLASFAEA